MGTKLLDLTALRAHYALSNGEDNIEIFPRCKQTAQLNKLVKKEELKPDDRLGELQQQYDELKAMHAALEEDCSSLYTKYRGALGEKTLWAIQTDKQASALKSLNDKK